MKWLAGSLGFGFGGLPVPSKRGPCSSFKSRSKDAPLFLTCGSVPNSAWDILMDPQIPGKIHLLDLSGTHKRLGHFSSIFAPSPPSNVPSIHWLWAIYNDNGGRATTSHIFSLYPSQTSRSSRSRTPYPTPRPLSSQPPTSLR